MSLLHPAAAATLMVMAEGAGLQQAVEAAQPGDVLRLAAGTHRGPVTLAVAGVTLDGEPGAVVLGPGEGKVITVAAPEVTVRGLTIRGSGTSLFDQDSAVFLGKEATGARVENNRLDGNLIGVYVWGAAGALVQGNTIIGNDQLRQSERGNGVQIWNAPGAAVIGNTITKGRDGVYTHTSRENVFRNNIFRDLRFAIHYMYNPNSEITGNISIGNDIGYALMYSDKLIVRDNLSISDRDHGFMFNYANDSVVENNAVRNGGEKCLFIYNANKNIFRGNWFEGCPIGIHFTAGSERNRMSGNSFIRNRTQVMYVGTRYLDWSSAGRGNFWSDNPGFDLNGDGLADTAYRPNDVIDKVVWTYPSAKLLLNSPGIQVIRWAQAQFPALLPGGVVDSAPLMKPEPPAILAQDPGNIPPPPPKANRGGGAATVVH